MVAVGSLVESPACRYKGVEMARSKGWEGLWKRARDIGLAARESPGVGCSERWGSYKRVAEGQKVSMKV